MARIILVLATLAAGCTSAGVPISYGSSRPDAAPPVSATPADGSLARYGLRPEDTQPFAPGALPRTHRVAAGETLYDIAARYQIPLAALLETNGMSAPQALRPGSTIALPRRQTHVVARGQTLRDIADLHEVDPRSLALLNRLSPPYELRAGQRIYLPFAGAAPSLAPESAPSAATLRWPLHGAVLTRFGAETAGVRSDALEIAGGEGAAIVAAADGEVVYAGEDLPAYGVLVLVRSQDGLVMTYGYLRRALVREGQRVRAGEAVGELGPGQGGSPRLLFQIRRGGEPVDPEPLLAAPE